MEIRSLAVGRGFRCVVDGCERPPGMFGACAEHREIPIQREFDAAVARGAASERAPPCYPSESAWREYVACWSLKERITSRYSKHVEYCRDCSAKYKVAMEAAGKCGNPETVFVRRETGEVVGVSAHFVSRWEGAILGLYGEVVSLPSPDAIERTQARIAADRAPKKMGRPRKSG